MRLSWGHNPAPAAEVSLSKALNRKQLWEQLTSDLDGGRPSESFPLPSFLPAAGSVKVKSKKLSAFDLNQT
ncbi:hypothetical protein NQZ68_038012 [Dissostichus eleginoides]|nr:hypothetical protein NQZ68_038012 [Dissostichus eleginoides]